MVLELLGAALAWYASCWAVAFETLHPLLYAYIPYWTLIVTALTLSPLTVVLPQLLKGELTWPREKDIPDVWTIHGKRYNLKPFFENHPGGSHVLRTSRGTDCTGVFESYHVFINRETLLQMLAKFEIHDGVEAEKPAMTFHDDFYEDLKQMVRAHFRGKGKGAHKMTTSHLCLCFIAWALMWYLNYEMVTKNAMWCVPFIAFLSWYLTGNVMHDASHNSLVAQSGCGAWVNRITSRAAFPYGVNVTGWHVQHVLSHHIYTNEEEDVDLYHFDPLITLQKGVNKRGMFLHFLRLVYLLSTVVPHLCIVVPYGLLVGNVDPAHGHRMYDRMKGVEQLRAILRGEVAFEFAMQLLYFYGIYKVQGFIPALCFYMAVGAISSYLFAFFTQVSHLQEECFMDPKQQEELSFAKRQVLSSMDFSSDSVCWGHLSGGLNTQALHHCFPSVSAMHLRDLYPGFRAVCKKHGVQLKEAPSLGAFLSGFFALTN